MNPPTLLNSTAKRVLAHVSSRTGVSIETIHGPCRAQPYVAARRRASRLFRRLGYSLHDIGYAIQRDHSTVFHHLHGRVR